MPPIILYDVYTPSGLPVLTNPWVGRICLVQKRVPFVTHKLTLSTLRAQGPGTLHERLKAILPPGGRPLVPMIEVPSVVDDTPYPADWKDGELGTLIGDSFTIAEYLDAHFTGERYGPSLFVPAHPRGAPLDTASAEFVQAHTMARMFKEGIGNSDSQWALHLELAAEDFFNTFGPENQEYLRSDAKQGFKDAWAYYMSKDRAAMLAQTRCSLLPVSAILNRPTPVRIVVGGGSASPALARPAGPPPRFLASPAEPGLLDHILFGRFTLSYFGDRALNHAIFGPDGDAARKWLDEYKDGKWKLQGRDEERGVWFGDVKLPGVEEWAERMMDAYDGYARKLLNGEAVYSDVFI